jgi:hypothetical protein
MRAPARFLLPASCRAVRDRRTAWHQDPVRAVEQLFTARLLERLRFTQRMLTATGA